MSCWSGNVWSSLWGLLHLIWHDGLKSDDLIRRICLQSQFWITHVLHDSCKVSAVCFTKRHSRFRASHQFTMSSSLLLFISQGCVELSERGHVGKWVADMESVPVTSASFVSCSSAHGEVGGASWFSGLPGLCPSSHGDGPPGLLVSQPHLCTLLWAFLHPSLDQTTPLSWRLMAIPLSQVADLGKANLDCL